MSVRTQCAASGRAAAGVLPLIYPWHRATVSMTTAVHDAMRCAVIGPASTPDRQPIAPHQGSALRCRSPSTWRPVVRRRRRGSRSPSSATTTSGGASRPTTQQPTLS